MRRKIARCGVIAGVVAALVSCVNSLEPHYTNVSQARMAWTTANVQAYRFEVAISGSWFPPSQYYRVQVSNGTVVEARDTLGVLVPNFQPTIEQIWDRILDARADGRLNSALFDGSGVPIESDMGEWALDGGVHYSVRNFARIR